MRRPWTPSPLLRLAGLTIFCLMGSSDLLAQVKSTEIVVRVLPGADREALDLLARAAEPTPLKVKKEESLAELLEGYYGLVDERLVDRVRDENDWIGQAIEVPRDGTLLMPAGPIWKPSAEITVQPGQSLSEAAYVEYGSLGNETQAWLEKQGIDPDKVRPGELVRFPSGGALHQTVQLRPEYSDKPEVIEQLRAGRIEAARAGLAGIQAPAADDVCQGREEDWPFDERELVRALHRNRRMKPRTDQAVVAVVDSGVKRAELEEPRRLLLWENPDEFGTKQGSDDDGNIYVDDVYGVDIIQAPKLAGFPAANAEREDYVNHGTHVGGLIQGGHGAECLQDYLDERLGLMILKVTTRDIIPRSGGELLEVDEAAVGRAIQYAQHKGADVVNLSLETYRTDNPFRNMIKNASSLLFVVAAGNGNEGKGLLLASEAEHRVLPAEYGGKKYGHVVTVAAHDGEGKLAPFSNYGAEFVDVAAPGCQVDSFVIGGQHRAYSGTSMAAGLVSMTAALLVMEELAPYLIKQRLLAATDWAPELEGKTLSGGILDPVKAVLIHEDVIELRSGLLLKGSLLAPRDITIAGEAVSMDLILKLVPYQEGEKRRAKILYSKRKAEPFLDPRVAWTDVELPLETVSFKIDGIEREVPVEEIADIIPHLRLPRNPGAASRWFPYAGSNISEPSGLAIGPAIEAGSPSILLVDDNNKYIYILAEECGQIRKRTTLELKEPFYPDDLEAIAFDGKHVFATTSHRLQGPDGREMRRLVRFELSAAELAEEEKNIRQLDVRDLGPVLAKLLFDEKIPVDPAKWAKWSGGPHPYAVEVEGLTIRDGKLLFGLKWPLDSEDRALLLEYDWDTERFTRMFRLDLGADHGVDGGGLGISALEYQEGVLWVAANPPDKEDWRTTNKVLGRSRLCRFRWPVAADQPKPIGCIDTLGIPDAKLEGLAIADDRIFMAYDGGKPVAGTRRGSMLRWIPLSELLAVPVVAASPPVVAPTEAAGVSATYQRERGPRSW